MKWKARTETMSIGELELGNLVFNEDYIELSIDICSISDDLKVEIKKAIEIRKVESVKEWDEFFLRNPERKRRIMKWSNKPVVVDYYYLMIVLESNKSMKCSIHTGFHDAENEYLEEVATMEVELSKYKNELKKAIIKVLVDKFF